MKTKLVATATMLCILIAASSAQAGSPPVATPDYTSPGIGTLFIHWLFGK